LTAAGLTAPRTAPRRMPRQSPQHKNFTALTPISRAELMHHCVQTHQRPSTIAAPPTALNN